MGLGNYAIKNNKMQAFHFTDPYKDIKPLVEFGLKTFQIIIKVNDSEISIMLSALLKNNKCVLNVRLGDYIVTTDDPTVPFKCIPQEIFEEKYEPVKAMKSTSA